MNSRCLIVVAVLTSAAALAPVAAPVSVQAKTMKECAAEWDKMKAAKQTGGMKYRDFSKQCMSGGGAPQANAPAVAPAPPAAGPAGAAPAPAPSVAKPGTGAAGRQAMIARERACGAEWKADKAAGKIPAGQKWPQYWSECDKRKKAQGM
jgi:hypothetical protein